MEADFWHQRWDEGRIGFHQTDINPWLVACWSRIGAGAGSTVFVPLCGKSRDMLWLRRQGHPVLGVELSEKAVVAFFDENGLAHERRVTPLGIECLSIDDGPPIRLIAGDYFALSRSDLAGVGALYDRASLIAMNDALRERYAVQLGRLVPSGAHGLLLVNDYDVTRMQGPPFAVSDTVVRALLEEAFELEEIERSTGPERLGGLAKRGLASQTEHVFRLVRRPDRAGSTDRASSTGD